MEALKHLKTLKNEVPVSRNLPNYNIDRFNHGTNVQLSEASIIGPPSYSGSGYSGQERVKFQTWSSMFQSETGQRSLVGLSHTHLKAIINSIQYETSYSYIECLTREKSRSIFVSERNI